MDNLRIVLRVGLVSGANGDDLKSGLILAVIFPAVLAFGTLALKLKSKNKSCDNA